MQRAIISQKEDADAIIAILNDTVKIAIQRGVQEYV